MFNFKKRAAEKVEKQSIKAAQPLDADDIRAVSGGKPATTPNLAAQCCNGKHIDTATLTVR
jgi:hypothetical protein